MSEAQIRIQQLIKKFQTGEITEAELLELNAWRAEDPHNEETFVALNDPYHLREQSRQTQKGLDYYSPFVEADFTNITGQSLNRKVISLSRWRWAAAAVFILAVAGTAFFLYPSRKVNGKLITYQRPLIDKLPGHNNATLTLANNRVIDLDKTKPGLIARQGNSSVTKTEDGKLVYQTGKSSGTVAINTLETPAGGQYPIVLEDGSKIFLNSVSKLDFPEKFPPHKRQVHFSGEGYFEIVRDSLRPFFVVVNGQEIRVTGTKFTVNSYADEAHAVTTLIEGGIKISNAPQDRYAASVSLNVNPNSIAVKPGQAVVYDAKATTMNLQKEADLDAALAFTKGQFVMTGQTVPTLMRQLARWYDLQIRYEEGFNSNIEIAGTFDKNQKLSQVIKILGELGVKTRLEGNTLIVTR